MRFLALTALLTLASALSACSEPAADEPAPGSTDTCVPGATRSCYTGPAATRDVALCHGGTETCSADGKGFGPCEGEHVPQPEACSGDDLACDGPTECTGDTLWELPFVGTVRPIGVAASADSEVTVFGWATSIDIGLGAAGALDSSSLFVARIGADGSPRWLRTFPGVDSLKRTGGIVMSADHRATLAISVDGSFTIDGSQFDTSPSGVLALRFDDGGDVEAIKLVELSSPPGALLPRANVVRQVSDGGVLVGGSGFLARLDADLGTTWFRRYTSQVTIEDLSIGADGKVYAAGWYTSSFEPGGGAKPVSGLNAGFLAELDGAEMKWSETLGGDVEAVALSVVVRPTGALLIGGTSAGGGSLIDGLGIEGSTGFLAKRASGGFGEGGLTSTFLGWGGRVTANLEYGGGGDLVVTAGDITQSAYVFKRGESDSIVFWARPFSGPVTATLPSGETIVATAGGVYKIAR